MLISAIEYPDLKTMKQILKQIRTKQYVCDKEEFEKYEPGVPSPDITKAVEYPEVEQEEVEQEIVEEPNQIIEQEVKTEILTEEEELKYCKNCYDKLFSQWYQNMSDYGHQQAVIWEIHFIKEEILNKIDELNNALKDFKIRGFKLKSFKKKKIK